MDRPLAREMAGASTQSRQRDAFGPPGVTGAEFSRAANIDQEPISPQRCERLFGCRLFDAGPETKHGHLQLGSYTAGSIECLKPVWSSRYMPSYPEELVGLALPMTGAGGSILAVPLLL